MYRRYPILKIGLDATPLIQLQGGIGYYIFYLLDALIPLHPTSQFILYTFSEIYHNRSPGWNFGCVKVPRFKRKKGVHINTNMDPFFTLEPRELSRSRNSNLASDCGIKYFKKYPNVVIRPLPLRVGSHSLWSQTQLPLALYKDGIDLFWGTTQSIPILSPQCKTLLLIHDFVYKLYPHTVSSFKGALLSALSPAMIHKATHIVCNSQGTKEKLSAFYGRQADLVLTPPLKASTCYQEPDERLTSLGLMSKGYFFSVGTLEPRKNWIPLIETYLSIPTPFPLVIAGSGGWKNKQLLKRLHVLQTAYPERIRCLGRVDDETLSMLYSSARYTLCLSLYEGYGMPIAESRVCQTPVICLDQIEMREAAENDALFLSSLDDPAFAHALATDPKPPAPCTYSTNAEKAIALSRLL